MIPQLNVVHRSLGIGSRRRFLTRLGAATAWFTVPGAFAEALVLTPRQTEGPFYPDRLPLDTDNDLLVLNDSITPAVGEVTWLSGRILNPTGTPIRNATIEIWQCDAHGVYIHSTDRRSGRRDSNFQGFGRFLTGESGEYLFRTIKPVAYPGRTPHIHMAVKVKGRDRFTTQCYVRGEPQNDRDRVLRGILDPKRRDSVIIPFTQLPETQTAEWSARFDVVLDRTPQS